jgi:hypothetical protein
MRNTICCVLAVREMDKVCKNCIIPLASDIEVFEIFRTRRSEKIDDDPI